MAFLGAVSLTSCGGEAKKDETKKEDEKKNKDEESEFYDKDATGDLLFYSTPSNLA